MKVLYRASPILPTKSPYSADDKFTLFKACLLSFIEAWEDTRPDMIFILDNCPKEYRKFIENKVLFNKEILEEKLESNFGTYKMQVDLASEIDDYVLFQEDDYLYLPRSGMKIELALKKFDFITPQDEYLYYFNEPRQIGKYEIKIVGNHHWREVNSTTLTFATHGKLIKENKDIMLSHGIGDYPMWQDLRANGYKIWGPIPSLAAHLVKGILPPAIDWRTIWEKY